MRRGFKSEAERISLAARSALGLGPLDRLDPWEYAKHLKVVVLNFDELDLAAEHRQQLALDSDSWSGMTLKVESEFAIVLNPHHAPTRNCATLMHELAHIILKHAPARVERSSTGMMLLSDYSEEQEDEADWLSAALLIPRHALLHYRGSSASVAQVASTFGVSPALCEWRLRMTGVDTQLRRGRRGS